MKILDMEIEIDTETIADAGFDRYLFRAFVEESGGVTGSFSRTMTADSIVGGVIGTEGVIYIGSTNIKLDGQNKRIIINDGSDDRILIGYQAGGF